MPPGAEHCAWRNCQGGGGQGGGINTALMMVNNGKYCNGGMIINPFATINDGLLDITWIDAPEYQGTLSVSGIMSRARSGGIQAYEGHSQYVRGRKLRIDIPEPEQAQPELELEESKEPLRPAGPLLPPKPLKRDNADTSQVFDIRLRLQ